VVLHSIPHFDRDGGCDPWFQVRARDFETLAGRLLYDSRGVLPTKHVHPREKTWTQNFQGCAEGLLVSGDVELRFFDAHAFSESELMCSMWFNTAFLKDAPRELCGRTQRLTLDDCKDQGLPLGSLSVTFFKSELDLAFDDKKHAKFDADFYLKILCVEHKAGDASGRPRMGSRQDSDPEAPTGIRTRRRSLFDMDESSKAVAPPLGLQKDREAFQIHLAECAQAGEQPCASFEDFLLNPSSHVKAHLAKRRASVTSSAPNASRDGLARGSGVDTAQGEGSGKQNSADSGTPTLAPSGFLARLRNSATSPSSARNSFASNASPQNAAASDRSASKLSSSTPHQSDLRSV